MPEALAFGLFTELTISFKGVQVVVEPTVKGHAVQAQVRPQRALLWSAIDVATLNVIQQRRAKRLGRLSDVLPMADGEDVRGVISSRRGRDLAIAKQPLANRKLVVGACRH